MRNFYSRYSYLAVKRWATESKKINFKRRHTFLVFFFFLFGYVLYFFFYKIQSKILTAAECLLSTMNTSELYFYAQAVQDSLWFRHSLMVKN